MSQTPANESLTSPVSSGTPPQTYLNQIAIVTGGASGIGYELAKRLVERGCRVVIGDRDVKGGKKAEEQLNEMRKGMKIQNDDEGSSFVLFHPLSLPSYPSLLSLFSASLQFSTSNPKRIDFVFANAGISEFRGEEMDYRMWANNSLKEDFELPGLPARQNSTSKSSSSSSMEPDQINFDMTPAPIMPVMDVNLIGALHTVYVALAYFRRQERRPSPLGMEMSSGDEPGWRGKIVCTCSTAAIYSFPADVQYAVTKGGVLALVRSLAPNVYHEGITINAVAPSIVPSALSPPDFLERLRLTGRLTSHETMFSAFQSFIHPSSSLTGQLSENTSTGNVLRRDLILSEYSTEETRLNMGEFWKAEGTAGIHNVLEIEGKVRDEAVWKEGVKKVIE